MDFFFLIYLGFRIRTTPRVSIAYDTLNMILKS